jgi:hypothetical protein
VEPSSRRWRFLLGDAYLMSTAHESRRAVIDGDGPPAVSRERDLLQLPITVPSVVLFRQPDRASLSRHFSDF